MNDNTSEHAQRVKRACERVLNEWGLVNPNRINKWLDGPAVRYGGHMLPLEKVDAEPEETSL